MRRLPLRSADVLAVRAHAAAEEFVRLWEEWERGERAFGYLGITRDFEVRRFHHRDLPLDLLARMDFCREGTVWLFFADLEYATDLPDCSSHAERVEVIEAYVLSARQEREAD